MQGKIPMEIALPPQKLTYNVSTSVGRTLKKPKIETQQREETCRLLPERFDVVLCMPKSCNLFILIRGTQKTYS